MKKILLTLAALAALAAVVCLTAPVHAQELADVTDGVAQIIAEPTVAETTAYTIDNLFLLIGAVLVIFMQPGFAMVEAGFNSAKNAVNILFKNVMDLCIGVLLYFMFGYGIMYGDAILGGFMGWGGMGIGGIGSDVAAGALTPQCDFLFRVAVAATAPL